MIYILYTNSLMPKDCKQNPKMTPVYDLKAFGYRNRRNIECVPADIELLWNCGIHDRPPTQLGVMAL